MYAIFEDGSHQFRVREGDRLVVDRRDGEPGAEVVTLDDRKSGKVAFPLADIQNAKLVLTDRLIAATRPLDTSGADDIETDEIGADEAEDILEEQED